MGAKKGKSRRSAGLQRFALVVFGAVFIALFVVFAVAEGIGQPSVPAGDVAIVQDVPDGNISEAELRHAVLQQAAQGGLKKTPAAGTKKFKELRELAQQELLNAVWIRGEAEELGITVTPKQLAIEVEQIKKANFKTEAAFREFLKTSHFTMEDVRNRVKLQTYGTQIQEQVSKQAPQPTSGEISDYYDAAKATQFRTPASRDVRIVVAKSKKKGDEAKAILVKDDSPASWKVVAKKYSLDPTTKSKGGLQKELSEEALQEPVKSAIFKSAQGEVIGPIPYQSAFYVVEVEKLNPEKVQTLSEVSAQIKSQLAQQIAQTSFGEFVSDFGSKWQSRTFCASGFVIERCANYVGSGRPTGASPSCYEANPKTPPKECPAPVTQPKPALPGTTTILKPEGERLPQLPRPAGLKETSTEGLTIPEGSVPGAATGTGE